MAAGDYLLGWTAQGGVPPTTRFATVDTFVEGSTPTLENLIADFDAGGTTEFVDFTGTMVGQYDGSSAIEVVILWTTESTTTSHTCKWDAAFRSLTPGTDNVATKSFASIQTASSNAVATARVLIATVIDFTNAEADGVQPDDLFNLRIERDSADAGDDMDDDDAELHAAYIRINAA